MGCSSSKTDMKLSELTVSDPHAAPEAAPAPAPAPAPTHVAAAGAGQSEGKVDSVDVVMDCVVIGGGFGGLAALRALRRAGLNAVLVTAGMLGEGQSIMNHGWIHRGYMPAHKAPPVAAAWWSMSAAVDANPDLFPPEACPHNQFVFPTAVFNDKLKPVFEAESMPFEVLSQEDGGFTVFTGRDITVSKPDLLRRMAADLGPYIGVNLNVMGVERREDGVWSVMCERVGASVKVLGKTVIMAAGTGTATLLCTVLKPPLQEAAVSPGHHMLRQLHMFCVRGPADVIGNVSSLVARPPHPPIIVACRPDPMPNGDRVLYVTPFPGTPNAETHPEHAMWTHDMWSGDATARAGDPIQPDYTQAALTSLLFHMPQLRNHAVRFHAYIGMKQDAGWTAKPMMPHVEDVETHPGLTVLNPQFMHTMFDAAATVTERVKARVGEASTSPVVLPWAVSASDSVIAHTPEDHPDTPWKTLEAFCADVGTDVPSPIEHEE